MSPPRAPMMVWVSHNALSEGVREVEVIKTQYAGIVEEVEKRPGRFGHRWYQGEGKQWHRTREPAVQKAEKMRVKRIGTLKKQLAKLEGMAFE